jgi:hypothetical protein
VYIASTLITIGCALGISWFLAKTLILKGETRIKQMIALLLRIASEITSYSCAITEHPIMGVAL